MPKGIREPYQELEGGKGFGGMGGGGGRRRLTMDERLAENEKNAGDMKKNMAGLATAMAGPVLGTVGSIVGGKVLADKRENERKEKAEREAAAELKRESRGMKKGGVTRADGCITKGHTRGKMV